MLRARDESNPSAPAVRRKDWRPQVQRALHCAWRDAVVSPYVRLQMEFSEPNLAGMWGRWREMGITGTDVARAVGLNHFADGDPVILWEELMGYRKRAAFDDTQRARVEHGLRTEDEARALYERLMGVKVTLHERTIGADHQWLIHGCDGHAKGRPAGQTRGEAVPYMVEIKCPKGAPYRSVPLYYMAQIQTGLALHEMRWCDFVVYANNDEGMPPRLKVTRIPFSNPCWSGLLKALTYFVDCLTNGTPPHRGFLCAAVDEEAFKRAATTAQVLYDGPADKVDNGL